MAKVTIKNLTDEAVYLGDIYTSVQAKDEIVINRSKAELDCMPALAMEVSNGRVAVVVENGVADVFRQPDVEATAVDA